MQNHVETGRSHPQTVRSLRMAWCNEALSLPFTATEGPRQNPKKLQRTHLHCSTPPLHPTLCIVLGDGRFGRSCSAMETHSPALSMHCPWSEGHMNVEVCRYWLQDTRDLCAFKLVVQVASYPEGDREAVCRQSCAILFLWQWLEHPNLMIWTGEQIPLAI